MSGLSALAAGLLLLLDRVPDWQLLNRGTAAAASFIGFGPVLWTVSAACAALATRRWWRLLAVPLSAGAIVASTTVVGYPTRASAPAPSDLRLLSLNTYYGWADSRQLATKADRADADVAVLLEVTHRTVLGLAQTDWFRRFPYQAGTAEDDWHRDGVMVFSRHPLTDVPTPSGLSQVFVVRIQSGAGGFTLISVHLTNPIVNMNDWLAGFSKLAAVVQTHPGTPLVVVGDFNAIVRHQPYRALMASTGLTDPCGQGACGWLPTFPAFRTYPAVSGLPIPLIQLDHVLESAGVQVTSLCRFRVNGTDHNGLDVGLRMT